MFMFCVPGGLGRRLLQKKPRKSRGSAVGDDIMNQEERRKYLIRELVKEQPMYGKIRVPRDIDDQKNLLHSLFNIRKPGEISPEFLRIQDEYLQEAIREKGITDIADLKPVKDGIYLWRGDITTLRCDAIVNAANRGMTGCYYPMHTCIDNCIHTYAGVQLRLECSRIMEEQKCEEKTGQAKITSAYNLPCRYVLHTVGPVVIGQLAKEDEELLVSCYRSCLSLARANGVESLAFCCISTGEFHFPNERAAELAIRTVEDYLAGEGKGMKIIFDVFLEQDYDIYNELLAG